MRTLFEVKVMSIDILIIKLLVFKVLRMDAGCFHNLEIFRSVEFSRGLPLYTSHLLGCAPFLHIL